MKNYLKLLRVTHYIKNLIVFMPLFFNKSLGHLDLLARCSLGFLVFCFISSSIYIFNDIKDFEKDRKHPTKCNRPIASGVISKRMAIITLIVCVLVAICFLIVSKPSITSCIYIVLYFVINIIYSIGGKNIKVIDIVCLCSGYPIRLLYGGAICGIEVSSWLFLTVLSFSLFFSIGKRRGEYSLDSTNITRPVLSQYSIDWLDGIMYTSLGLGIMFYSLWAVEKSSKMVFTVPIVLIISMYYSLRVIKETEGDPVNTLLGSIPLLLLLLFYSVVLIILMYVIR